jgi:hypothetical protein
LWTEWRPPRSASLLVLRERMVSREATASLSSLRRGILGNMLCRRETFLFLGCFLDAFLGPFLPPVKPRLQPVRAAAMVAKSWLSMSDSVFLEFAETYLLRRGSLDLADCREEEEMVEIGDSMGREAVESLREAESCAPCPGGREGVSERPETWRARKREVEPAAGVGAGSGGVRAISGGQGDGGGGQGGGGC